MTFLLSYCRRRSASVLHCADRYYSRISPPSPVPAEPVIRVINGVAQLGIPKEGPKPRQLLSLPPFPSYPLPGRCSTNCLDDKPSRHVTAISWLKYYFEHVHDSVIQSHFNKGLVQTEFPSTEDSSSENYDHQKSMRKIKPNEVMEAGTRIYVPVSIAESRISRRFDTIPSGTLHPNADEIKYMQRLVQYKALFYDYPNYICCLSLKIHQFDSSIIVLNKPPKLPVKGNVSVHNSMDALAAAALSYGNEDGPKLVHRLDRETSGLLLMGRTRRSTTFLQQIFSDDDKSTSSCGKAWKDAREATCMRYWALVIGCPQEKEGIISAPLMKVLLDDGKTERVIISHGSGLDSSQEAITEYRVLGPTINGCSWIELRPHTSQKHQLRVHCAEALGTPIVGDYKYGWFVHKRWKHISQVDIEPTSGNPYRLRRPAGLDVQKGSVLSKVPLLHLNCRELLIPNVAKLLRIIDSEGQSCQRKLSENPELLRFVASMPSHMKISWNLMSSYLV
ncbi:hypothetical protein V2J09_018807 [Rumex salicifolius]